MKLHDYTGVIHFHSNLSFDGHAGLDKIITSAAKNGMDFLMLTDHDHLQARDEGWEGWQGKVLLIVGQEIAPRFNHYLAFNISAPAVTGADAENILPQQYIDAVNNDGGFGFIAHPDHEGTKTFHVKHYPWLDWSVRGYMGVSIWDFMTDWQSSLKRYLPSLMSFFFPAFFLRGPRHLTLARWDALNREKKIVGIGELDNHCSVKKICGIEVKVFPFDLAFKFVRTHICTLEPLSGDNANDIALLYNALRHGRCYVAMEYFQPAKGFQFFLYQNGKEYSMGDMLNLKDGQTTINIALPATALVRIIRNGSLIKEEVNKNVTLPVYEKGVYRVEASLKKYCKYRPWIFSNPIFVK